MKNYSLLRYPGGKSAMSNLLMQIRNLNDLGSLPIAEPFGGGAGASMKLLLMEEVPEIYINDADPAIYDIWFATLRRSNEFAGCIERAELSIDEWRRQRNIYKSNGISHIKRGFSAFYLNRCNRSGIIINGGPIGGVEQRGRWKLDARFNRAELASRVRRIAEYGNRIHISGEDGIEFIESKSNGEAFLFVDPPYYAKGKTLYLNELDDEYHSELANKLRLQTVGAWVLTYDDCPEIRRLYDGWSNIRPFSLRYAASERRDGREIMVTPKWMKLPVEQRSASIGW